jgi:[ribosomal protein S5]-alanine N-acetyltransferase
MLPTLLTERLLLRDISTADFPHICELDADPNVMELITATGRGLTRDESIAGFEKMLALNKNEDGLGVWFGEVKMTQEFVGLFGLKKRPETDEVEIGYRLKPSAWRQGYATEGSRVLLDHGFRKLHLPRIVGVVDPPNFASIKVLEKLGLTYEKDIEITEHRDNVQVIAKCYVLTAQDFLKGTF